MQNVIQHNNLSRPVYERLKGMIANGMLSPGQKLIQEKLATEFGVSRTPLLKALQSLEHEMLVESIPRRGIYVRQISMQEMIVPCSIFVPKGEGQLELWAKGQDGGHSA